MPSNSWWPSSSDDEEEMFFANAVLRAGQILIEEEEEDDSSENAITRRIRINRDRQGAHEKLVNDYFSDEPLYNDEIFRRRVHNVTKVYCGHSPTGVRDSGRRFGRVLEAVASQDLWICHSFFGLPGSLNDLNVLYQSAIFTDIVNGTGPDTRFTVSGVEYRRGYYLADGIYPSWSTIVKTIPYPEDAKRKKFAKRQEAARKDIDPPQQDLNSFSLTNNFKHANLQQDLVEHIWNNVNIGDGDGDEVEDE
ncbi:uncharacterized protein LOC118490559 [Helianthus annuus]|uniref:uncharacterized protein LOC118490559 n=1 Tax=Helianthus annuus TaxID=4232 RepID=UPI00165313AA|nr:uncharacterized protein LOC118490559 [Helianthus annuus]